MTTSYRHTLEKLAAEPPATKNALICSLLREIESALASGKTYKQVWQRLVEEGLEVTYKTFHKSLRKAQKKPRVTAAWAGEKPQFASVAAQRVVGEIPHDPLVNLREVEASRPGFPLRETKSLDVLVHGRRESNEQRKR